MTQNSNSKQSLWNNAWNWIQSRFDVEGLIEEALHVEIPEGVRTFFLGGMTLFFLVVQITTGILLALYYQPSKQDAYQSVLHIMNNIRFGWLIRSVHSWGANLMIISCILHLLRIYFQGVYKKPREITWTIGVVLLLLTMGFGFTGYLLPWDQRAFWATTVGTQIAASVPGIGEPLGRFLRVGTNVSGLTLSRFFGIHTLVLPLTTAIFVAAHLLIIHKQGLASPPLTRKQEAEGFDKQERKLIPFFPHYILDELIAWYTALALLVILASVLPMGLHEQANPLVTPEHIKPEWYFLFLYQALKFVPRVVGVLAPGVGVFFLLIIPYIDRKPNRTLAERRIPVIIGIVVMLVIIGLTIWGQLS